jgi:hypothetical protein
LSNTVNPHDAQMTYTMFWSVLYQQKQSV